MLEQRPAFKFAFLSRASRSGQMLGRERRGLNIQPGHPAWSGRALRGQTNAVSGRLVKSQGIYRHSFDLHHVLSRSTRPAAAVRLLGRRAAAAAQDSTGCSEDQGLAAVRVQQSGQWPSGLLSYPAQAASPAPCSSSCNRKRVLAWTTRGGLLASSCRSVVTFSVRLYQGLLVAW